MLRYQTSDGKFQENFGTRVFWRSTLPIFQILNVFLIKKQHNVNANVAFKKFLIKKNYYRENVLIHSIVYNFTPYSLTILEI